MIILLLLLWKVYYYYNIIVVIIIIIIIIIMIILLLLLWKVYYYYDIIFVLLFFIFFLLQCPDVWSSAQEAVHAAGSAHRPDCVRASEQCLREQACSTKYRTMRQCVAGGKQSNFSMVAGLEAKDECRSAMDALKQSPLYNCRCKRGMKKEKNCLRMYWGMYQTLQGLYILYVCACLFCHSVSMSYISWQYQIFEPLSPTYQTVRHFNFSTLLLFIRILTYFILTGLPCVHS